MGLHDSALSSTMTRQGNCDLSEVTARIEALSGQLPIQCTQSQFDTMVHLPGRIYVIFPDEEGDA